MSTGGAIFSAVRSPSALLLLQQLHHAHVVRLPVHRVRVERKRQTDGFEDFPGLRGVKRPDADDQLAAEGDDPRHGFVSEGLGGVDGVLEGPAGFSAVLEDVDAFVQHPGVGADPAAEHFGGDIEGEVSQQVAVAA